MEENQNNIKGILNLILTLQKNICCNEEICEGCTRPFLGPSSNCAVYNTRPITLYSCCTGNLWTMPFSLNGTTGTSSVFRIENVEGNCATFRILTTPTEQTDDVTYIYTDSYFTIDLSCILAIQCLPDTFVC